MAFEGVMKENQDRSASVGDATRDSANSTIAALSRILAILVVMMLLGVGGGILDRWLGTSFLLVAGFAIGILLAMVGMFYVVKVAEIESRQIKADLEQQDPKDSASGRSS